MFTLNTKLQLKSVYLAVIKEYAYYSMTKNKTFHAQINMASTNLETYTKQLLQIANQMKSKVYRGEILKRNENCVFTKIS